jgi:WD40 repeat protein
VDTGSGKEMTRIDHGGKVDGIAFSPDNRFLATASDDKIARLVETASGKEVARIEHTSVVRNVDFSLDSRFLKTESDDYTARLWNIGAGKEVAQVAGVDETRFSPDSRFLAARRTGPHGTIMWLVETASGTSITERGWRTKVFADRRFDPLDLLSGGRNS